MDFIERFENYGHLGKSVKHANTTLVFLARGIYVPWKMPIIYFLSQSAVKSGTLKILIVIINELFCINLNPKIVLCEQGTNNQRTLKSLNGSPDCLFFFVDKNIIFAIFVFHLIKSVKNNLITRHVCINNKIISFSDIKAVYEIKKQNFKIYLLLKLIKTYLNPTSFQKIHGKLATQLISFTVASTIKICVENGKIKISHSFGHGPICRIYCSNIRLP